MQHDSIHKLLCAFPRVIADILRGYLGWDIVARLDFNTLEQVSAEQVTQALRRRLSDSVWRVRCDDGTWVWIYVILEFQSRPDPGMALRLLGYVGALYEQLQRLPEYIGGKVPPVLAIVLYNGKREWAEVLATRERIALEPGSDVEEMLPRLRFPVIDERRAERLGPDARNAAELMFRLWSLRTKAELADLIGSVLDCLPEAEERPLREAFEQVIVEEVVPAYFGEGSPLREARELVSIETMLKDDVMTFEEQAERRGLDRGLDLGCETIRSAYARMTRVRFGPEASKRLEALLRPVLSLRVLGKLGEIMVAARTGEELLASVAARLSAEPGDGRSPA